MHVRLRGVVCEWCMLVPWGQLYVIARNACQSLSLSALQYAFLYTKSILTMCFPENLVCDSLGVAVCLLTGEATCYMYLGMFVCMRACLSFESLFL